MRIHDVAEETLRFLEVLALESRVRRSQLQVRQEVRGGEEAFDAMPLFAIRVELQNRRRPLRAVALRVALEVIGLLANV